MITGIDHAVVLVDDLEAAVSRWERAGFAVILGGRHKPAPTENAVIPFADGSYIELFAFGMPYPEHRWWDLERSDEIVDYSCMSTDIERDLATLERAGVTNYPRQTLQRILPNDDVAEWVISAPRGDYAGIVPFLIADVTARRVRVPPAPVHMNGVRGIAQILIAVPGLERLDPWCKNVTGWTYRPIDEQANAVELRRHGQTIRFVVKPSVGARSQRIQLVLRTDATTVSLKALIRG